jgi:hypothetical protein
MLPMRASTKEALTIKNDSTWAMISLDSFSAMRYTAADAGYEAWSLFSIFGTLIQRDTTSVGAC